MIIQNGLVYGEDYQFTQKEVYTDGTKIAASGTGEVLDATDCYVVPGFTDIHFHGCMGSDFCDGTPEAIETLAEYEAAQGVTTICPATMTLPQDTLNDIAVTAAEYVQAQEAGTASAKGAALVGINMEGPFLSYAKRGAQNPEYLHTPSYLFYRAFQKASGGIVKLVAIAPEEEGSLELIQKAKDETVLSIANTTADYDTSMAAFRAGASHVTHLYNAMPPLSHRAPGVIGAAFDTPNCRVELICDGVHVVPAMIRATFQLFSDERVVLVSDSMMACGMADGKYSLGGQDVKVRGPLATLADGTIAGSATNLSQCVQHAVSVGIPLESVIKCAAVNPAKAIGIFHQYGSITPGKVANIVLLNKSDLSVKTVVLRGKVL